MSFKGMAVLAAGVSFLVGCAEVDEGAVATGQAPDCEAPITVDTGTNTVPGTMAKYPDEPGIYCAAVCLSPLDCETADDCYIGPCVRSSCVDGACVNVAYPHGSSCLETDRWTLETHEGHCDACDCRP